jgi:hypothetical protein
VTALSDAMTDLVDEMRRGTSLNMAATLIAPDYKLHPDLLVRKFHEGYPSGLPRVASPEEMERFERSMQAYKMREFIALIERMVKEREEAAQRRIDAATNW